MYFSLWRSSLLMCGWILIQPRISTVMISGLDNILRCSGNEHLTIVLY